MWNVEKRDGKKDAGKGSKKIEIETEIQKWEKWTTENEMKTQRKKKDKLRKQEEKQKRKDS